MPDYSKGKIYKILNNIDDEIYVGSTIETLGQRMAKHRRNMKTTPHYKLYKHMHELGVESFYIELVENCPCNDVYELRAREGHYIRQIGTLNKRIEGRTHKEWCADNCEYLLAQQKKYRDTHKEGMKQYRKDNKEHIQQVVKQYFENNKDVIRQYKRQYNGEKITCNVCGCQLNRNNLARRQRTNKCKLMADNKNKQITIL